MTEARIIRIDYFYQRFPDMRPQVTRNVLGTRYVYIHRLDTSKPAGAPIKRLHRDVLSPLYPDLEHWLMENYHPHMKIDFQATRKGIVPITEFNIFKLPHQLSPAIFADPDCSYHEVYHCAAAFTYELLYRDRKPQLRIIDDMIHRYMRDSRNDPIRKLQDDVNTIIDQHIVNRYKSMPNATQELKRYIETKV